MGFRQLLSPFFFHTLPLHNHFGNLFFLTIQSITINLANSIYEVDVETTHWCFIEGVADLCDPLFVEQMTLSKKCMNFMRYICCI